MAWGYGEDGEFNWLGWIGWLGSWLVSHRTSRFVSWHDSRRASRRASRHLTVGHLSVDHLTGLLEGGLDI